MLFHHVFLRRVRLSRRTDCKVDIIFKNFKKLYAKKTSYYLQTIKVGFLKEFFENQGMF